MSAAKIQPPRPIRWAILNAFFLVMVWYGFVEGMAGPRNIATFMSWMALVGSLFSITQKGQEVLVKRWRPVPEAVDVAIDIAVIVMMIWNGAFLVGAAYLVHTCFYLAAQEKADKVRLAA